MTATVPTGIPPVSQLRQRLRRKCRRSPQRPHPRRAAHRRLPGAFLVLLYGGSAAVSLRRHLAKPSAGPVGLETHPGLADRRPAGGARHARLARAARGRSADHHTGRAVLVVSHPIDRAAWLRTPLTWLLTLCRGRGRVCRRARQLGRTVPAGRITRHRLGGGGGRRASAWGWPRASVVAQAQAITAPSALRPSDVVLLRVSPGRAAVATRVTRVAPGRRPFRRT